MAKCDILMRGQEFFALELHISSLNSESSPRYRVFTHEGQLSNTAQGTKECRYVDNIDDARVLYASIYTKLVRLKKGFVKARVTNAAQCFIGSDKAIAERQKRAINAYLPPQVQELVETVFREANNRLCNSINDFYFGKLTVAQLEKAEAILLHLADTIKLNADGDKNRKGKSNAEGIKKSSGDNEDIAAKLSSEYFDTIKENSQRVLSTIEAVEEQMELVQLMKDMITVRSPLPSCVLFTL